MVSAATPAAYAGDISVYQAWDMLEQDANAVLVDVRTPEEWTQVGTPDLSSLRRDSVRLSWRTLPGMRLNPAFERELCDLAPGKDTTLLFLCKAGGRSMEAACSMTRLGYTQCYNIAGGFEDAAAGWQANRLPWSKA